MKDANTGDTSARLALNQREAASSLGMSVNTFKSSVRPYVKYVSIGRLMLFPVVELEAWLARNARGLD